MIIASHHPAYRHMGLNAGETVIYAQWGQFIKLTESGVVIEANNQPVTVNNATEVTVNATVKVRLNTPLLEVSGNIIDNADSNSATLKAYVTPTTATIINLKRPVGQYDTYQ